MKKIKTEKTNKPIIKTKTTKTKSTAFRRTKEEIQLGLTIAEAKQSRLLETQNEIVSLVDEVGKTLSKEHAEKRNRRFQRKKWVFTLNNYEQEDVDLIKYFISSQCSIGAFQSEIGETRQTPHLQGFFITLEKRRFTSFKLSEKIHWELMRGNEKDNLRYCLKDHSYDKQAAIRFLHNCSMPVPPRMDHLLNRRPIVLKDKDLFLWQKKVCDIVIQEPDDRIIYYKYDSGNTGKSQLVKKLVMEYEALSVDGAKGDITYTISAYHKSKGYYPPVIVLDIPRSQNAKWSTETSGGQSYSAIEAIKNGIFNSTKYESEMITMAPPHIFIFSNSPPNIQLFTKDRWRVEEIRLSPEERITLEKRKAEARSKIDQTMDGPPNSPLTEPNSS
jgi:hypothetical protein